jgi:putative ABC transport system permease protein
MIWSVAWKNIWRNKRRSLVVIAAVTIGIISGVLIVGIMKGWVAQRIDDVIHNEVSHIQIHNKEFLKNEETDLTVAGLDELEGCLDTMSAVAGWVKRTRIVAMANTPWANTGLMVYGVEPEKEKLITGIVKRILPGAGGYLNDQGDILISDKTAEILKLKQYSVTARVLDELMAAGVPGSVIKELEPIIDTRFRSPGDFRNALRTGMSKKELDSYGSLILEKALDYRIRNKVQITISDERGTPIQGIFRVCGIYKTTNTGFDQSTVFVNANELSALYGSTVNLTNEISVLLKSMEDCNSVKEKLAAISPENSVRTWKELAPEAAMMNDFMVIYYFMFIGIIMLALAFGIINTMLMAILERTRELGMLMAIGMNRKKVFVMIMLETIFLTSVGAVAGMLSGWLMISILGKTGIHFSGWGEGFEAIGFAATVYPVVTTDFFIFIIIMVITTAIISSLWPARKALKLNPVEALRTE